MAAGHEQILEELSLEPFTALSIEKLRSLEEKISMQRRFFFPPQSSCGEGFPMLGVQSTGAAAGRLTRSDTEGHRVCGSFLLPENEGAGKKLSGQKQ